MDAPAGLCPTNFSLSPQLEYKNSIDKLKEALNKFINRSLPSTRAAGVSIKPGVERSETPGIKHASS